MRRLTLLLIPLTFIAFTLLLGAAGLIGRGSASPVVVAQTQAHQQGFVHYALTDVDRRITLARQLNVPDVLDERWYLQPPLVLQRETPGGVVHWTLSTVDVQRNTFTPVMRLTMSTDVYFRIDNVSVHWRPDGSQHATAYVPHTGEIWTSTSDNPDATLLSRVPQNAMYALFWSPDNRILSLKDPSQPGLTLIDASDGSQRTFDAPESSWASWSRDSRHLLIVPFASLFDDSGVAGPPSLVDTQISEQIVLENANSVTWCRNEVLAIDSGGVPSRAIRLIDPVSNEARQIFDLGSLPDFELTSISPMSSECDLLSFSTPADNELRVLNLATGKIISLGQDVLPQGVFEEVMIYQTRTNDGVALWRLDLGLDVPPVLLGSVPFTFGNIRWLDDWQRGLSYDSGRLNLIDLRDSSKVWLANAYNGAFFMLRN
jgi:hypothetical protein